MSIKELAQIQKETLTCADIAPVLGIRGDSIHLQAMERPERLGFPVICVGNKVLIPKIPFLRFMGYEEISK